jgi:SWI/SNF-related matrix-associated actin-dependent regulator 1 of chromatin subfamily A
MKITKKCPVCGKTSEFAKQFKLGKLTVTTYSCGHTRSVKEKDVKELSLTSKDGKHPYKYQLEGAHWAIKNNCRVLIADEMGVGKTIQGLLIAHSDPSEYCPVLVICKTGLKAQWMKEAYRWCGWMFQIIEYEEDYIIPNMDGYIVSYDSLTYSIFTNKKGKVIERGMKDVEGWFDRLNPRLVILDECQAIKNTDAKRTRSVQKIARKSDKIVALSGTPILNNAKEYFPVLNMLQPERFPTETGYIARWCESYWNGNTQKIGGISDPVAWKAFTEDFIIRRTRAEVLPDLPMITRNFRFEELGPNVEKAYKETFEAFQNAYYYGTGTSFEKQNNILAYLSKMRHLTGIAKIPGVVEFVEEFIADTDRKIVIFCHHKDVAGEVTARLNHLKPLSLPAPVDPAIVDKFWQPEYRIMVASTLAAGEGLNLQCCSDCIMMEPQWNPSKEDQAESRFPRPGQQSDKITSTHFIAIGTVDEFFSELKEQKRSSFGSTIEYKDIKWDESSLLKELAEVLAQKGGKRWNL